MQTLENFINSKHFNFKAPRDLAEAAYLTATNSLILTDFCVKFSSEKVACFCIYLACKWTGLRVSNNQADSCLEKFT